MELFIGTVCKVKESCVITCSTAEKAAFLVHRERKGRGEKFTLSKQSSSSQGLLLLFDFGEVQNNLAAGATA